MRNDSDECITHFYNNSNDIKYVQEILKKKYKPVPLKIFHKLFAYPNQYIFCKKCQHKTDVDCDECHGIGEFQLHEIYKRIPKQENYKNKIPKNADLFDIVKKVYFCLEGENDVFGWYALVQIKLKNKLYYAYYVGCCDYTGFDCQGRMSLYIAEDINILIKYAMSSLIRFKILMNVDKPNYYLFEY